ncbi:MAG: metallophosphoesterase [Verrucomicrobiaceae bacterium]|nr:metallophosphoesterase [Verrucomicrobiaceae bacterium]
MSRRNFFMFAIVLLALLHSYIGWRLLPDLPVATMWRDLGALYLALSCAVIPLGMLARGIKRQPLADRLAWLGFLSMGLFSSLLILTVLRDVTLLGGWSITRAVAPAAVVALPSWTMYSAIAAPVLALLVTLIGFINARRIAQVIHVDVPLANLPAELHGFTIAQISDVHVGPTIKRNYLKRIVERINGLDADIVAITGDLVDGRVSELTFHTAPLADIKTRYGSYFVTGNHEYYSNAPEWITELKRLGLRVLLNEHVVVSHNNAALVVAGITDFSGGQFDPAHRSDAQAAIAGAPVDATKLLLAHQPRSVDDAAKAGFDIQLSGHTHGGQFWPWNFFVPLQQPYTAGLHRFKNMWIYVSRGTGYWGPPKRFGAPSEITRLRLVRA